MGYIQAVVYVEEDAQGNNPVRQWLEERIAANRKDKYAARIVAWLLYIEEQKKLPNCQKPVTGKKPKFTELTNGAGGARLYLYINEDRSKAVILGAGTKNTQSRDIKICRKRLETWLEENNDS